MTYALHQVMYDYQRSGIVSILLFVREADRPVRLRPIDSETRPRGGAPAPNSRSGETQLQVQAASVAHSRLPDFASEDSVQARLAIALAGVAGVGIRLWLCRCGANRVTARKRSRLPAGARKTEGPSRPHASRTIPRYLSSASFSPLGATTHFGLRRVFVDGATLAVGTAVPCCSVQIVSRIQCDAGVWRCAVLIRWCSTENAPLASNSNSVPPPAPPADAVPKMLMRIENRSVPWIERRPHTWEDPWRKNSCRRVSLYLFTHRVQRIDRSAPGTGSFIIALRALQVESQKLARRIHDHTIRCGPVRAGALLRACELEDSCQAPAAVGRAQFVNRIDRALRPVKVSGRIHDER